MLAVGAHRWSTGAIISSLDKDTVVSLPSICSVCRGVVGADCRVRTLIVTLRLIFKLTTASCKTTEFWPVAKP